MVGGEPRSLPWRTRAGKGQCGETSRNAPSMKRLSYTHTFISSVSLTRSACTSTVTHESQTRVAQASGFKRGTCVLGVAQRCLPLSPRCPSVPLPLHALLFSGPAFHVEFDALFFVGHVVPNMFIDFHKFVFTWFINEVRVHLDNDVRIQAGR